MPARRAVLIRRGPRERFVGPAFVAAEHSDLVRLADATGATVRPLPESLGGVALDLVDPSGLSVRVVSGTHQLEALPAQTPHVFNFGHDVVRANATQRPPRVPTTVQRLGHIVVQTPKYIEALNWHLDTPRHDRQRLLLLPRPARARTDHELHPLRPRFLPRRSPHPGDGAGSGQPLRAFGVPGL